MAARQRPPKPCTNCATASTTLFRIKISASTEWQLLCKTCQLAVKDNEGYQYGGTWKSNKRG